MRAGHGQAAPSSEEDEGDEQVCSPGSVQAELVRAGPDGGAGATARAEFPTWDRTRASQHSTSRRSPFDHVDGNVWGFARATHDRGLAAVADAGRTLLHEVAHVRARPHDRGHEQDGPTHAAHAAGGRGGRRRDSVLRSRSVWEASSTAAATCSTGSEPAKPIPERSLSAHLQGGRSRS